MTYLEGLHEMLKDALVAEHKAKQQRILIEKLLKQAAEKGVK